ncbi:MAG: IS1182 family transposase [bacterium]|nr:IS1182 family transposase [bacterium]
MNSNFRDYCPDQAWVFPPALSDLIAPDDPLHVFSEAIDRLDLSAFYARYSKEGSPAYHPRMMVKVLAYAYSLGLRSSRRIASLVRYDVRFMYLAGLQQPDFRTLSDFRLRHLPEFTQFFEQIVKLCRELGLVALDHVAIDGTKMEANAAWTASRTRDRIEAESEALRAHITALLAEAEAVDQQEDAQFGSDRSGTELPQELAQAQNRKQKIDAALNKIQKQGDQKINLTDPDARVMRHYGGKQDWSYNAQVAVDAQSQVIVAAEVVTECTDQHQLAPMYHQVVANTGQAPTEISADAGYATGSSQVFLEENSIDAYMPDQYLETDKVKSDAPFTRDKFSYDAQKDAFTCPEGKILKLLQVRRQQGINIRTYRCAHCPACPHQRQCVLHGKRRTLKVSQTEIFRDAMRVKLASPEGHRKYQKRQATVEPVIGHLKCVLGFRSFLLRGLRKAQGEFHLIASVHNLRKMCFAALKAPPPGCYATVN